MTAVLLVTLTLWIQCAGIAVLIRWARASIGRGVARLSSLRAAILMIRFSTLMIVLHFLQIFFWSVFYRWHCLPSWESSFYFSASSYSTVGHRPHATGDAATAISPDGSKVVFERICEIAGKWFPGTMMPDCSFLVPAEGGHAEQLCEVCMPRGFSSDGSMLLIQKLEGSTLGKGRDRIALIDVATKTEKDFLSLPSNDLYHAYFSWDDRWVVFKKVLDPTKAQILIAPVRNHVAGKESAWVAVTDGRFSYDKPQFSPDGNTIYFTSTRDGYLCIWAQRLNPTTKHPLGPPIAYEHFRNSMGRDADQGASDLNVAMHKT
jgi:WD40-like Beta Propeller Repeat